MSIIPNAALTTVRIVSGLAASAKSAVDLAKSTSNSLRFRPRTAGPNEPRSRTSRRDTSPAPRSRAMNPMWA